MRRKIFLHGSLAKLVGQPVVELEADTIAEAINGLCTVTGKALWPDAVRGRQMVKILGVDDTRQIYAKSDTKELHLVPAFSGGGGQGGIQVVIGVVIIIAAIVLSYGTATPFIAAGGGLSATGTLALAGALMVIGGVVAMMSPAPKAGSATAGGNDPDSSKYLAANQNTVKIGTRIPILVGRFPVYGQFLSFNVDAKDVVAPVLPPDTTDYTTDPADGDGVGTVTYGDGSGIDSGPGVGGAFGGLDGGTGTSDTAGGSIGGTNGDAGIGGDGGTAIG